MTIAAIAGQAPVIPVGTPALVTAAKAAGLPFLRGIQTACHRSGATETVLALDRKGV